MVSDPIYNLHSCRQIVRCGFKIAELKTTGYGIEISQER
jgi:hypothetical protein